MVVSLWACTHGHITDRSTCGNLMVHIIQFIKILNLFPKDIYNLENICLGELGNNCVRMKQLQVK